MMTALANFDPCCILALGLTTLLAASGRGRLCLESRTAAVPAWLAGLLLVALALAPFAFGTLDPDYFALVGAEGVVNP